MWSQSTRSSRHYLLKKLAARLHRNLIISFAKVMYLSCDRITNVQHNFFRVICDCDELVYGTRRSCFMRFHFRFYEPVCRPHTYRYNHHQRQHCRFSENRRALAHTPEVFVIESGNFISLAALTSVNRSSVLAHILRATVRCVPLHHFMLTFIHIQWKFPIWE